MNEFVFIPLFLRIVYLFVLSLFIICVCIYLYLFTYKYCINTQIIINTRINTQITSHVNKKRTHALLSLFNNTVKTGVLFRNFSVGRKIFSFAQAPTQNTIISFPCTGSFFSVLKLNSKIQLQIGKTC